MNRRHTMWPPQPLRLIMGIAGALVMMLGRPQAAAQPELPVDLQILQKVNLPQQSPRITLHARERVDRVQITVTQQGRRVAGQTITTMAPGSQQTLTWRAEPGVHRYVVKIAGRTTQKEAQVSVDAVITVMRPLEVTLHRDQVDLQERSLRFSMNNPAGRALLSIDGASGQRIHEATTDLSDQPAGARIELRWPELKEAIARIELRVYDASESWSDFEILPFAIEIPHEDVIFETGSTDIRPSEQPKLQAAHAAIVEAVRQHGSDLKARLYVLGHTDTVGSPKDNQRLSRRRAVAIAQWFARRGGIGLPILAQGFGESQLLIKTGDEVDEPRNRRAQYILATQPPLTADWTLVHQEKPR